MMSKKVGSIFDLLQLLHLLGIGVIAPLDVSQEDIERLMGWEEEDELLV